MDPLSRSAYSGLCIRARRMFVTLMNETGRECRLVLVQENLAAGDGLKQLLVACGAGDRNAFKALYEVQSSRLLAVAMRVLGNREAAEDVLQDAFVTIWRKAGQYQPQLGSAAGWMTVIVRHRCIDRIRSEKARFRLQEAEEHEAKTDVSGQPDPFHDVWVAMDGKRLRVCMENLNEGPRKAMLHAYYDGLTHEETADRMATPLGTVKSWVRRALVQLKRCLEP
jgi:RNA polymerase sigma-70 factor, ECF subfamily